MNVADLLRETAKSGPGKAALVYGAPGAKQIDRKLSYADFDGEVDRVASALVGMGVEPGDRVAVAMGNVVEFPISYFGILRAGGVVVPLNVMYTEAETERILRDAGVSAVLGAAPYGDVATAAARAAGIEHVVTTGNWDSLGPARTTPVAVERDDDDLAVLAYTSGTTSDPKGVVLTHGNLLANLRQQMAIPDAHVTDADIVFLALPLFHIFGLNVCLGLLVMNGATGVLIDRFEPIPSLRLISEHKVSVLFGAPTMFSAWVSVPGGDQYDLSSVRLAVSGAAPLAPDVLRDFRHIFGVTIYEGYGLTETAPTVMSNRMTEKPRAGSVGKPLPEVEYRLLDEEGKEVEFGDPGEIVVRGPNVFKGYWNRPEETEKAFYEDGWFRTGDIAIEDEDGYVYLVDRKRDLIIVSGFNVFPSEVETALVDDPKVAEAAVVGVPHPYTGEAVKAYVVLEEGESATAEEIMAGAHERLARFKCPYAVEIVERLPHLPTGKVLKRALRT